MTHVDFTSTTQNIISLCTGIRGLERGLERTGIKIRTVVNVEIETFICENLAQEMDFDFLDEAPTWSNLKTFDGRKFRGLVDGITGGYPCQPFSSAGKRNGTEDPRHLWPYIGGNENNIIKAVRPLWCFFENVRGHVTLGLREVIASLEGMGYRVHWGIFSAEETGASHKRERVFILGIRTDSLEGSNESSLWNRLRTIGGESGKQIIRQENGKECSIWPSSTSELGNTQKLHAQRCNPRPWQIQSWRTGDEREIELANNFRQGLSEWQKLPARKECQTIERSNRIVARPGESQHEWESPRTTVHQWETKSELGGRIDGYNFREDFLRSLGNSVYEDSAELAFVTLLRKHGIEI